MNNERITQWSCSTAPVIGNYKLSLKLKERLDKNLIRLLAKSDRNVYSSFGVIRSDSPKATYNAYFSGHINVTGIRKRSDIEEVFPLLLREKIGIETC